MSHIAPQFKPKLAAEEMKGSIVSVQSYAWFKYVTFLPWLVTAYNHVNPDQNHVSTVG